jgi:rubredoxin
MSRSNHPTDGSDVHISSHQRDINRKPTCAGDECGARGRFRMGKFRPTEPSESDPDGRDKEFVPFSTRWLCPECAAESLDVELTDLPGPEGRPSSVSK